MTANGMPPTERSLLQRPRDGCAFVIFGAIKQLQRRRLLLVMASNFVALLPCVSPMGFPSAVWSLVGLYRNEVKSSFR